MKMAASKAARGTLPARGAACAAGWKNGILRQTACAEKVKEERLSSG